MILLYQQCLFMRINFVFSSVIKMAAKRQKIYMYHSHGAMVLHLFFCFSGHCDVEDTVEGLLLWEKQNDVYLNMIEILIF